MQKVHRSCSLLLQGSAIGGTVVLEVVVLVSITQEAVLKLAVAVAEPRSRAMYISADNGDASPGDWPTVAEAARSGRSFAVRPHASIVTVDSDTADEWMRDGQLGPLLQFNARLKELGLLPVIWKSGRPGHHGLVARVEDPSLRARVIEIGRDLRLQLRIGQLVRPPLSPHRLGLPVELVGIDPQEAFRRLNVSRETSRKQPGTGTLPPEMEHLLVHGGDGNTLYERKDGGCDRSKVLWAIVLSAVQRGVDKEDLWARLLDPRNAGGARLQRKRSGVPRRVETARKDYDSTWLRAEEWVREHHAIAQRPSVQPQIDEIAVASHERIRGRSSATDVAVLDVILRIGERTGKLDVDIAVRTLVEKTGFPYKTVWASIRRLRLAGWLHRKSRGRGRAASAFELRLPPALVSKRDQGCIVAPDEGLCDHVLRHRILFARSIRGRKALGPTTGEVLDAVRRAGRPVSISDVSRDSLLPPSRATVYRAVKTLQDLQLILVDEHGLLTVPDDVEQRVERLERELQLDMAVEQLVELHGEERIAYRAELDRDRLVEMVERWHAMAAERDEIDGVFIVGRPQSDDQQLVEGAVAGGGLDPLVAPVARTSADLTSLPDSEYDGRGEWS